MAWGSPMRGFRSILIAGLAGMLLIFTLAAVESVRLLAAMRLENQVLRQQALERSHHLARVRSSILLSQTYVSGHAGSGQPAASQEDVRRAWTAMMADLAAYRAASDGDGARIQELRGNLDQHWRNLSRAMENAQTGRDLDADDVRSLQVSALGIETRVEDIDAKQAAAAELSIQDQFESLGHGLGVALNLALAAALLLALGSGIYILRIERQNRRRYEEIAEGRRNLEQLSARLVDAQETERRTISRELHDQVGQTLNAVLVDAANLARRIPQGDEEGRQYLNNIRMYADSSINAIRDIALLLRPSMLDDLGLIPALEWQARETSRRTGIDVKVTAENVDDLLPDAARTCVYRVVQEALQNASRHSHASHVKVTVRQAEGTLDLSVEDDGTGFDPRRTRGMGLVGMEERVRQLGGRLEVDSAQGKGTRLRVAIPAGAAAGK